MSCDEGKYILKVEMENAVPNDGGNPGTLEENRAQQSHVVQSLEELNSNAVPDEVETNKAESGEAEVISETEDSKDKVSPCTNAEALPSEEVVKSQNSQEEALGDMENKDTWLETINKYMNLVANKKCHSQLLQDPTISGFLVLCLGETDPLIVERSFEVFYTISKFHDNLSELRKVNYLVDALRVVARNSSVQSNVRLNAKNLIAELKSQPKKDTENQNQPLAELSESMKNTLSSSHSENRDPCTSSSISTEQKPVVSKPPDLNTTMSTMKRKNKGREIILFLESNVLQQRQERAKITQALIGVPGIISVTYDLKNNHCVLRGKRSVPQENFGRAVASLGLAKVYLVGKNEKKEEVKTLITAANDKENAQIQYPPYPEELENEEADNSAALARQDTNPDNPSFFKSAKNFIKRSFYW